MNYAVIKPTDVANGPGVRVSLFVSGCTHHCKSCFNAEAWDFSYGQKFLEEKRYYNGKIICFNWLADEKHTYYEKRKNTVLLDLTA